MCTGFTTGVIWMNTMHAVSLANDPRAVATAALYIYIYIYIYNIYNIHNIYTHSQDQEAFHPLLTSKPATMTQSAQTTNPPYQP